MIACSLLGFTRLSFESACAEVKRLGFRATDVAVMEGWAHFNSSALVEGLDEWVTKAREALEKNGLTPVSFNASSGTSEASTELPRFQAICQFANDLGVRVICYSAPPEAAGFESSLKRYERLRDITNRHHITLAVEAHVRTLLERPEVAARFCKVLGGVYLTLDPSHIYAGPHQGGTFDELYPYVRHTHWRDSGNHWDRVQMPPGKGLVDFPCIIRGLKEAGYKGAYSVEYIDTFPDGTPENILAMKSLLEKHIPA